MSGVSDFALVKLINEDIEGFCDNRQDDTFPSFISEDLWSRCSVTVQLGSSLQIGYKIIKEKSCDIHRQE